MLSDFGKNSKLTSKINPFCDSLGYSELYCEPDLAQYLETQPGRPCWINGYWLKPLEIKNILLFNSFCFLHFQSSWYCFLFLKIIRMFLVEHVHSQSLKPNLFYQSVFAFFSFLNTFLVIYLAYFMSVPKAYSSRAFFLSSVCSSSYKH